MVITKKCAIVIIIVIIIIGLIITNYIVLKKCDYQPNAGILDQNTINENKNNNSITHKESMDNMPPKTESDYIVLFYANWCGACKQFKPTWEQFKQTNKSNIKIIDIDCDLDNHKELCRTQNIEGYPTVIYYGKQGKKEFNMNRTVPHLEQFIKQCRA